MHRREVSPPTLMVSVAFVPVKWLLRLMRHHRGGHFQGSPSLNQDCTEALTESYVLVFWFKNDGAVSKLTRTTGHFDGSAVALFVNVNR